MASKSAKALAQSLNCKRIKLEGTRFIHRPKRLVINWGCNDAQALRNVIVPFCEGGGKGLNDGISGKGIPLVTLATNKLSFFNTMNDIMPECIPEYTDSIEVARKWCLDGVTVVCRQLLNASSGRGIVIAEKAEDVVHAPLYVKYVKKQDEYRVHVFNGEVIDIQRKMRKKDVPDEEINWRVRNHNNGFIFARNDINPPNGISNISIGAVRALGLDFGAVDIIYNQHEDKLWVLEINTAPGLEGTTLEKYTEAVRSFCDE